MSEPLNKGQVKVQRAMAHKRATRERLLRILAQPFGWRCWYCGSNLIGTEKHVDHIVPRSSGGTDDWDNLALTCAFCNMAKSYFQIGEFYAWLDRVRKADRLYEIGGPHPNASFFRSIPAQTEAA